MLAMAANSGVHAGGNDKKDAADDPKQDERTQYIGLLEYTAVQNALGLDKSQKKEIADVNKMLDEIKVEMVKQSMLKDKQGFNPSIGTKGR